MQVFEYLDPLWMFANFVALMFSFGYLSNYDRTFAGLALFVASLNLPAALVAGLCGVYPVRLRWGYDYYAECKNDVTPLLTSGQYPELQIIGWVQLAMLLGIIVLSIALLR